MAHPHYLLFQQAVKKASATLQERGRAQVSQHDIVEEIALYITYSTPFEANEQLMLNYWRESETASHLLLSDAQLPEGLARYLDYKDYQNWQIAQEVRRANVTASPQKRRVLLLVIAVALVLFLGAVVAVFLVVGE